MGKKIIDLREVIRKKSPKLAEIAPNWILKILEKILCIKELNELFIMHKDLDGLEFNNAALEYYNIKVKVVGEIPSDGRFIFASNHPIGGADSLALASEIGKKNPNLKFVVNDILMELVNMRTIFVPVNKMGAQAKESAKALKKVYDSENQIAIFPAGLASRKIKGQIVDLQWQKNFIFKAIEHQRDIVTIRVLGGNSNFFYGFAKFREFLEIKLNIEQILLPRETAKQKNKTITLIVGETFSWELFDKKSAKEDAQSMREYIYTLGAQES